MFLICTLRAIRQRAHRMGKEAAVLVSGSPATCTAAALHIAATLRSKLRTPAW